MPDISMCRGVDSNNKECSRKHTCYRYTTEPDKYRQSYILVIDVNDCDLYWKNK